MRLTPHFVSSEFDSPDAPGSGQYMDPEFIRRLEAARVIAGHPFRITSGYRTEAHNTRIGGVPGSAHTKGMAADISTSGLTRARRNRIIAALGAAGFQRIGEADSFLHVDIDTSKPTPAFWAYTATRPHIA